MAQRFTGDVTVASVHPPEPRVKYEYISWTQLDYYLRHEEQIMVFVPGVPGQYCVITDIGGIGCPPEETGIELVFECEAFECPPTAAYQHRNSAAKVIRKICYIGEVMAGGYTCFTPLP